MREKHELLFAIFMEGCYILPKDDSPATVETFYLIRKISTLYNIHLDENADFNLESFLNAAMEKGAITCKERNQLEKKIS